MKKILHRFKNFLPFFQKKDTEPVIIDEAPAEPSATVAPRKPGLDCPKCQFRITISIPELLSGGAIICPICQLQLTVDKENSHHCLQKLKELQGSIDQAEKVKNQPL